MTFGWLGILLLGFFSTILVIAGILSILRQRRVAQMQRFAEPSDAIPQVVIPLSETGVLPFDASQLEDDTQPYAAFMVNDTEFAPMLENLPPQAEIPAVEAPASSDYDPDVTAFTISPNDLPNPNRQRIERLIAYFQDEPQQPAEAAD